MLKAYRYHPNFLDQCAGGFNSLTYSHKFDAMGTLCQHELLNGQCTFSQCPDEHFRSANLTGAYEASPVLYR